MSTADRIALRDEARRQKIHSHILGLIEENLKHFTEHLDYRERQERFLIGQFLCLAECPWCDSKVSYFEAVPEEIAPTFKIGSGPDNHACPHCSKRIVYTLPFMGNWYWRKHKDDKNPNRVTRG